MRYGTKRHLIIWRPLWNLICFWEDDHQEGSLRNQSLLTYALAAVASSAYSGISIAPEVPENQFLLDQLNAIGRKGECWDKTLPEYLSHPAEEDLPLVQLGRELGLTTFELLVVSLAAAVEVNAMAGRALAHLQVPLGGSRPSLGLLSVSLGRVLRQDTDPVDALVSGTAVRSGLLVLRNEGVPLTERIVMVPTHLVLALRGHDASWAGATIGLGEIPQTPLPTSIVAEAQKRAMGLLSSSERLLVLRSSSRSEGWSVVGVIARVLNRRPLFIETQEIASFTPWIELRRLLPVFCFDLAPGESKTLPDLPFYQRPVLVLCDHDGRVEVAGGTALNWTIPVPSKEERRELWQIALGNEQLAEGLSRHHRHGSGRIAHLGRLARYHSALNGREVPTDDDLVTASWVAEGAGLDALAQPLTDPISDKALMMSPMLRRDLQALLLHCRSRDGLTEGLGASASARYNSGVRALFVGPSGTGKTLAAGWLATKLGLPLYRVDLASVLSKYIGETEKNLAQMLARAEQAEVVLLFDEADSLFGKRTDVQQANDRFANAQTNYLLQRIEYFNGITILTSNSRSRLDQAFTRRLDVIIDFPAPGPEERRLLWESHLGEWHLLSPRELNRLSAIADLTGGEIRNVVLAAAVLAQEEGRPIGLDDVLEGLSSEYRKLGRQVPVELAVDGEVLRASPA
jgi:hypothetical protein